MLYTLLFAIGIVGVCMILLGIKVLLVRGGRFPNFHIESNSYLRKKGITCATHMDAMERKRGKKGKEVH
ncbi:MAG TPA: hypothetical protein DDY68_00380 [Porphyromonadaceae bacterium]|nr:hypothetical protein [Porphyromonadaceae bacterium]